MRNGFSLLELLFTLALLAIISVYAFPNFQQQIQRHKATAAINQLYGLLIFGRSQAINYNKVVTLCASNDGKQCNKSRDWSEQELLIFIDENSNGQVDETDKVLQQMTNPIPSSKLHYRAFQNKSYLQWLPTGTTNYQSGHLVLCIDDNAKNGHVIIMNFSGRPYIGKDNNKDGIVENGSKKNISCQFS